MSESKADGDATVSPAFVELEMSTTRRSEMHHLNEKVHDGDEALKVLNTHYEPYTPEEEKKVLRKIDMRMCLLMCAISESAPPPASFPSQSRA